MAKISETNYIRDVKNFPLIPDDLKRILEMAEKIKVMWGDDEVIFYHNKNMIYPFMGSFHLIGSKGSVVEVRDYSVIDFCSLVNKATSVVIAKINSDQPQPHNNLFQKMETTYFTDYSQIITDLEEFGLVATIPSTNILRSDERKFYILPKAEEILQPLGEWGSKKYEVDLLGCGFWKDLTEDMETLWKIIRINKK